jgi:tetratricopeptide (TPR) repeat protein
MHLEILLDVCVFDQINLQGVSIMKPRSTKTTTPSDANEKVLFSFFTTSPGEESSDSDYRYQSVPSHSSESNIESDDAMELDDPVAIERNDALRREAAKLFQEGDVYYYQHNDRDAITRYEAAISLLVMIPVTERCLNDYANLDSYSNNLAQTYFRTKDYALSIARYLKAFNTLSFIEDADKPQHENQYWLAEYSFMIARSLKLLEDTEYNHYLRKAIEILREISHTFGLTSKDKSLLADCHMLQNNYFGALRVLEGIESKSDKHHRKIAECNDGLALDCDPFDQPVTEASTASANYSLSAILERNKVKEKTGYDLERIDKYAVDLKITLADIEKFIKSNKRKLDQVDAPVTQETAATSAFSIFAKKPRLGVLEEAGLLACAEADSAAMQKKMV